MANDAEENDGARSPVHSDQLKDRIEAIEARLDAAAIDEATAQSEIEECRAKIEALTGDDDSAGEREAIEAAIDRLQQRLDAIDTSDRGDLDGAVADTVSDITGNEYS